MTRSVKRRIKINIKNVSKQTIMVLRFRSFARSKEFFMNGDFNVVRGNFISGWIRN